MFESNPTNQILILSFRMLPSCVMLLMVNCVFGLSSYLTENNVLYVLRSTVASASALLRETAHDSLCLLAELRRHTPTSSSARSTGTPVPPPEAASVGRC